RFVISSLNMFGSKDTNNFLILFSRFLLDFIPPLLLKVFLFRIFWKALPSNLGAGLTGILFFAFLL
ncbi:uncharacterized protein EV154DRAFT_491918, partial [Mucor mucedo]|uniref:uncharacterized protein n=1 Tax=Mucor mucedo TaxID=29922 RepID=UPI00221F6884